MEKGVGIVVAKPEKAIMALVRVLEAMGVERVEMGVEAKKEAETTVVVVMVLVAVVVSKEGVTVEAVAREEGAREEEVKEEATRVETPEVGVMEEGSEPHRIHHPAQPTSCS